MLTILRQSLTHAIERANAADEAFGVLLKVYGYKSRWDWSPLIDDRPKHAYLAKIQADENMHEAFEKIRAWERGSLTTGE